MSTMLFLSHSGADTEAARKLKRRLEEAIPGLKVWFDKDDLIAGIGWQPQLEKAIKDASAFALYVGSKGIVNWVEAEVREGLSRAYEGSRQFPFVPILSAAVEGSALPGFVRQFQAVRDVENNPDEFKKLVAAILNLANVGTLQGEKHPFFGLKAIDEARSHLFFGRKTETDDLVQRLASLRLIMVTGDSGSGKSSLVRAGVVPRWRGGEIAEVSGQRSEDTVWNVIDTRPQGNPRRALGDAVFQASQILGRSAQDCGTYKMWALEGNAEQVRDALRCGLNAESTRTLLVIDQFEELWTMAPPDQRLAFLDLLLELANPNDDRFTVILTMRLDYYFQCSEHPTLYERLESGNRRARYLVGRISDHGLLDIVTKPLRLAGVEQTDAETLARTVLSDVGQRPGDLALVQFALTETWRRRGEHGGNLISAYLSPEIGRVEGALARAAERVFEQELSPLNDEAEIEAVFLRLVKLGDAGGATRRLAVRREFDDKRWSILQRLASDKGNRLVLISGNEREEGAEISHEALVTQWPRFQRWIRAAAGDKRTFDELIDDARDWNSAPSSEEKSARVATGAQLASFADLAKNHSPWLSATEHAFVRSSQKVREDAEAAEVARHKKELSDAQEAEQRAKAKARNARAFAAVLVGTVLAAIAGWGGYRYWVARDSYLISYMIDAAPRVPGRESAGEVNWLIALNGVGRTHEAANFATLPGVNAADAACPIAHRFARDGDTMKSYTILRAAFDKTSKGFSTFRAECLEAATMIGRREPDKALELIDKVFPSSSPWELIDALTAVGRATTSDTTFHESLKQIEETLFDTLPLSRREICRLAESLAKNGDIERSRSLLKNHRLNPSLRDHDSVECIRALKAAGVPLHWNQAIELIKPRPKSAYGARNAEKGLVELSYLTRLAGDGEVPVALTMASRTEYAAVRSLTNVAVLRGLPVGASSLQEVVGRAIESARAESDAHRFIDAHLLIALALLEHSQKDPEARKQVLALLSIAGDRSQSVVVHYDPSSRIDFAAVQASNFADIAMAFSRLGETKKALEAAQKAELASRTIVIDRSTVLGYVAKALAAAGEHALAVEVADRIYDGARLTAYAWVLEEFARKK